MVFSFMWIFSIHSVHWGLNLFFKKIAISPLQKKVTPLFPSNPPLKVEVLSSPPPFWKFGWRFNPSPLPPRERWGGCTLWHTKIFYQYLACCFWSLIVHLFFQIPSHLLLTICMDDLEYTATLNYVNAVTSLFCFHLNNHQN